jgi:DNA-binding LacI/PurR family transcriptional regulator
VHHVTGPVDSLEARGRLRGWRRELIRAGSPVPEPFEGDWTAAAGHAVGRQLVAARRRGEEVTAVFVANDQMALGLLNVLHAEGVAVPREVSVVGFDDVPEAAFYTPPLTTVRQDFAELGRRGVALVLCRLSGAVHHPEAVLPQLVVRGSTGLAPGLDHASVSANI